MDAKLQVKKFLPSTLEVFEDRRKRGKESLKLSLRISVVFPFSS